MSLLTAEANSDHAVRWFRDQAIDNLMASPWTMTEIASALALKRRTGALDHELHDIALDAAKALIAALRDVTVTPQHFAAAADRFVNAPPAGLRAGDALHLAIAVERGAALATLDRQLGDAAATAGLVVPQILPT
ncbi:hypothetical protein GGQ80_000569 [Sphingomonas jinjuensis]|uniref:PIN domain-containing protein n=1 Tax=Sphingomonas jinjuensis TaxID=535907 RepID=A0A840F098_9SPHN|nr:hypothetical protein [Sphingomonas jinjuensis]